MKKIDLEDVSFLIPVRIDSKERFENINWIIEFIWKYFNTTIIVLEADETERFHNSLVSRKIFVKDHDRVFHRTKYINKMIRESTTDLIAVWDTDVFADYKQTLNRKELIKVCRMDKRTLLLYISSLKWCW